MDFNPNEANVNKADHTQAHTMQVRLKTAIKLISVYAFHDSLVD